MPGSVLVAGRFRAIECVLDHGAPEQGRRQRVLPLDQPRYRVQQEVEIAVNLRGTRQHQLSSAGLVRPQMVERGEHGPEAGKLGGNARGIDRFGVVRNGLLRKATCALKRRDIRAMIAQADRDVRTEPSQEWLQLDTKSPTGTVNVQVCEDGQPKFQIAENVAWDNFEWTSQWQTLAGRAAAICFGSLAQRSERSRAFGPAR